MRLHLPLRSLHVLIRAQVRSRHVLQAAIESLEERALLSTAEWLPVTAGGDGYPDAARTASQMIEGVSQRVTWDPAPTLSPEVGQTAGIIASAMTHPLSSIPPLHSDPGAKATLFLDFDGHYEASWGVWNGINTPVFDTDGDPSTFSDRELAIIEEAWTRTAEDFAPFDVDVTTVEPAVLAEGAPAAPANGVALRVAIGGTSDWTGASWGGYSYINSFTSSIPNVSYVFAANVDMAYWIGDAISHEAGHAFGLEHQSTYDADGTKHEYSDGNATWAPIMGATSVPKTTTWYNGPSTLGPTSYQDDMAIIARPDNGFGYRADDAGDALATATVLPPSDTGWSGSGIIGTNTDQDVFQFHVSTADVYRAAVLPAAIGANLDAVIELRDAAGHLLGSAAPADLLRANLVRTLAPGDYYLTVKSSSAYGWIGQYRVVVEPSFNGVTVAPTSSTLSTDETGQTAAFTVRLDTAPRADVVIPVRSSNTAEGVVSTANLIFTPSNWYIPQTVVVTGMADGVAAGDTSYVVILDPTVSADPDYDGIDPADVAVINHDVSLSTQFYVVNDGVTDRTYEYTATGASVENHTISSTTPSPRGVTTTATGTKVWVVDANKTVSVSSPSGVLLGSWTANGLVSNATIEGIATNGVDVWIVDARQDRVYRYANAAARLSGRQSASDSFALNSDNRAPTDLVTDGSNLWVVNDSTTDKVFKYTLSGSLLGSWTITGAGSRPTGITLSFSGDTNLWIVDSGTDRVYQFNNARSRSSGSQSPSTSFALAAGNTNPQGIADPPPGRAIPTASPRRTSTFMAATSSPTATNWLAALVPAESEEEQGPFAPGLLFPAGPRGSRFPASTFWRRV